MTSVSTLLTIVEKSCNIKWVKSRK